MGCGVGLGIITLVSFVARGVEERAGARDGDGDGDGTTEFSVGRKSASKSGEVGHRAGDGTTEFSVGRKSVSKSGEVGYRAGENDDCDVSRMVAAVGGVSWTIEWDEFGVQSNSGAGDGTSCAKVNGIFCVHVVSEGE